MASPANSDYPDALVVAHVSGADALAVYHQRISVAENYPSRTREFAALTAAQVGAAYCTHERQDHSDRSSRSVPRLDLLSCGCGPSECPVEERLELSMEFTLDRPLRDARWEIKFVVDSVYKRHVIVLGATDRRDYPSGKSSMHFQVPRVSVEGIKPCTLANTGLLVASLRSSSEMISESSLNLREKPCREENRDHVAEHKGREGKEGRKREGTPEEEEVACVNLVIQVADAGGGRLERCIYSPLE